METLYLKEKNLAGSLNSEWVTKGFGVSTVFNTNPSIFLFREFEELKGSSFLKNEMIGTTIFTDNPASQPEKEDDEFETGYYNDDYDIVAKAPITKSFKIKVKIRSISRLHPKVFIDNDELNQLS